MAHTRLSIADKRRSFRHLHEQGCFVIPNPWDVGSARYLQTVGFKALATTSSGFAWSHGHADGGMSRDRVLEHVASLVESTDVPINADLENGFSLDAGGVAESVRLALESGCAGLSIEDSTGSAAAPLYDIGVAVERMRAARSAVDRHGPDALLVGRAECFLVGRPDLDHTVERLKAYSNAGADCLYAPGIMAPAQIGAIVEALAPKPVNVLISSNANLTVQQLAALGVRRISVGGALARAAWGGFMRAARLIHEGRFDGLAEAASGSELNVLFGGE